MAEDLSLEMAIAGKLVDSIPQASWELAVNAATATVLKVLAPVTETTSGLGRIIKGTFDDLEDWRKIAFAKILQDSAERIPPTEIASVLHLSPRVIVASIEEASRTTEPPLQELWSNLLARVFVGQTVHPEVPRILGKLTPEDALTLLELSKQPQPYRGAPGGPSWAIMNHAVWIAVEKTGGKINFDVLRSVGLIDLRNSDWVVTSFGEAFIVAVSQPTTNS
jgi:hypothetical protein